MHLACILRPGAVRIALGVEVKPLFQSRVQGESVSFPAFFVPPKMGENGKIAFLFELL
ncbi:hypothetical protein Desku_0516 [Desulfofundulus kuznetsovii DSM 6115]|uniref:Uncharacterized protein n=1 Tax=Desulfofundulus kuznetsovii (strain DSM 6115 / VKM B-1805 / 17) TaxID=760568 RepID=A0AAU8PF20_DESK7|nr:hypothetical protein Desku_0516 [Desulfofundulus kuznetsovii DSM 6115]